MPCADTHYFSGYTSNQLIIYKPLQNVIAYDGDTSVKFAIVAASLGPTTYSYSIQSAPPGSQFFMATGGLGQAAIVIINTAGRPVTVNDDGTVVQCIVNYGSPTQVATYTATLTVLGKVMVPVALYVL